MNRNKNMKETAKSMIKPDTLVVDKKDFIKDLESRIELGKKLLNENQIRDESGIFEDDEQSFENQFSRWNNINLEMLKQSFNNEDNAYRRRYNQTVWGDTSSEKSERKKILDILSFRIKRLCELLDIVDRLKEERPASPPEKEGRESPELDKKRIFIVHGHNNEVRINVARTLEKLGLFPIILHEQANAGKTIIEKFEEYSNVGFAIILMTDDDLGRAKNDETLYYRARQNVILEMGFFIGKLGRNRVCPLYTNGVKLPSDLYGLLYTEIDSAEKWKISIARELKAAGYEIDINKII